MRRAELDDAFSLVRRLRPSDLAEIHAGGLLPVEAIRRGIRLSEDCDVAELDGLPVFVIGLAVREGYAVPWLLGTKELDRYPGALTKVTLSYIEGWLKRWPKLGNYVYAGSAKSVRWLEVLGFTVYPAQPHGPLGELFHPFTMEA